jgi:hypothetical protein
MGTGSATAAAQIFSSRGRDRTNRGLTWAMPACLQGRGRRGA